MPRSRLDGTRPSAPNKRKLTSLTVQRLKPTERAYLVWDEIQRGLCVNVQPSGYRAYKFIFSKNGRPRWISIAACDAVGLSDARKLAAGLVLKVAMGQDPAAERRAERCHGTFAEIAEQYMTQHAMRKNKSWRQAKKLIDRNVLPKFGSLRAADVTRSDVRSLMSSISAPVLPR